MTKVKTALIDVSLGDWRKVIEVTRDELRISPQRVLSLIEFWKKSRPKWTVEVLHWRLTNDDPSIDIADGWLPPSPDYQAARRRLAEQQDRSKSQREAAERHAKTESDKRDMEEIENLCSSLLDEMSRAETREMLAKYGLKLKCTDRETQ